MDEDIRPEAVCDALVLVDGNGKPHELSVEFDRADGQHCFLIVPLQSLPGDRGTRLLNRLRVHGVHLRVSRHG